jgi:hypothetical protein
MSSMKKHSIWSKYSYGWLTAGLFLFSIIGHWLFGWWAYVNEQAELHHPVNVPDYTVQMLRDVFENWQSEFLQLIWQVCGLAYFLYAGSPQSREGDERMEAKLDAVLKAIAPQEAEQLIRQLSAKFPKN